MKNDHETHRRLTEKQLAFANKVASEGVSYTEAYRRIYECSGDQKTISKKASALANHPGVAAKLAELRDKAAGIAVQRTGYTLAAAVKNADDACRAALKQGRPSVAVSALTLKCRLLGLLGPGRKKVVQSASLEDGDAEELRKLLAKVREEQAREQAAGTDEVAPAPAGPK